MPMMLTNNSAAVLSGKPMPVFVTPDLREYELSEKKQGEKNKKGWDGFIDSPLVEWGRDTTALEDEDFVPPNPDVINLACKVAMSFRDEGIVAPTRVVPDGEGGISFERVEDKISESLNIYADKSIELLTFDDCRLRDRRRLM